MTRLAAGGQAGFTLVEMMVALTIGLFLAVGFTVSLVGMKSSFLAQDQLSQLQDNERLALSLLTSAVQQAGYFPDALNSTAVASLPSLTDATYGSFAAGQAVVGMPATGTVPESLTVRFASASGDGLLNCLGGSNTSGAQAVVRSIFAISAAGELSCSVDAGVTFVPLVSNVNSMSVLYGCDSSGDGNVDRYLTAAGVTGAALWMSVRTMRITLVFKNAALGVGSAPTTTTWVQAVNLMNYK